MLRAISSLAADPRGFDYAIIESSGISEPLPVAETFTFADEETGVCLGDVASLDTMVTVVDASTFALELASQGTLLERGWQATEEDSERTIAHLLVDQVEFSNVIVLNKCDLLQRGNGNDVSTQANLVAESVQGHTEASKSQVAASDRMQLSEVKALIRHLNPAAVIIEATYGDVDPDAVLGTKLFSAIKAAEHPEWLVEARHGQHTPETVEYAVSSFTYRNRLPFHPQRLYDALNSATASLASGRGFGSGKRSCAEDDPNNNDPFGPLQSVVRAKVGLTELRGAH